MGRQLHLHQGRVERRLPRREGGLPVRTLGGASRAIALHAARLVDGAPEPMYDLDFTFDSLAQEWGADFPNARVSIRWAYRVCAMS
jgi:hypothetical protein